MTENKSSLFDEFPAVSKEKWLEQLEKDLKGIAIEDKLLFTDPIEQFKSKSHFHWSEEAKESTPPFIANNNDWIIRQTVASNQSALSRLNEGASGIGFSSIENISQLLKSVEYSYIYTDFKIDKTEDALKILEQLPLAKNTTFAFDPILKGNTENLDIYFDAILKEENVRGFEIDNAVFASAGANISQQLGIAIAQLNEYLNLLVAKGFSVEEVLQRLQLKLGIGQNYLHEIAKFRAIRILVQNLAKAYDNHADGNILIHAESIALNKSLKDPYTNLLRLTTEGMSAASGGADIITLLPYDFWSKNGASDFAYRMSTNIAHILKEEAYLSFVSDPLNGAYSVEHLTEIIAENAWNFFKTIETKGGFLKAIETKFISNEIEKTAQKRIELFQSKTKKHIGINIFENPEIQNESWNLDAFSNVLNPLILELNQKQG